MDYMNGLKTVFLMVVLTGLLVLVGDVVAGRQGMIFALILAAGMNFAAYWLSDRVVLAMYRARPIDESQAPGLYRVVRRLADRAGLPMPRVFIIPQQAPNAFATGRNPQHAVIAVTQGLLSILNEDELAGVIAHELAHVRNRDMLIGTLAATMAGALMILARLGMFAGMFAGGSRDRRGGGLGVIALAALGALAAVLIRMAISRSREYQADESAAELTGDPGGLARALSKLEQGARLVPMDAEPSTSHLFIVNPLRGDWLASLFSTHPPIRARVSRLQRR